MAKAFTCDGCGAPVTEDSMVELGHVLKSQYCETCGEKVKSLAAQIDQLHTEIAEQFAYRREVLVTVFKSDNPGFRELPDGMLQFAQEKADG
jgi:transcription elongation factor Elf1